MLRMTNRVKPINIRKIPDIKRISNIRSFNSQHNTEPTGTEAYQLACFAVSAVVGGFKGVQYGYNEPCYKNDKISNKITNSLIYGTLGGTFGGLIGYYVVSGALLFVMPLFIFSSPYFLYKHYQDKKKN